MFVEYLSKKRKQREDNLKFEISNGVLKQRDDDENMEEEESKNEKSSKMRSGDKYVIRKLVSLKISPEDMQEYLNMLTSGTPSLPMMTPSYHTYLSIPSL